MKRVLLYIVCLPNDLIAWLLVLCVRALWGKNLQWEAGSLVCTLREDSWPARTWYSKWNGTTFGHGIFYHDPSERLRFHESVHVEQSEAAMTQALVLALIALALGAPWWAALVVWALGFHTMALGGWVTAWLRGEPPYRGSQHEESAYSQARREK